MSSQGSTSRFADYFVVSGLDAESGLEPDQLSGDTLHWPPLDRPFKSKVLYHIPDHVSWNPFDKDAVGMLCLPRGLAFATQKDPRRPRFHSFLITKEDGSRVFGAALTFYEEVKDKKICAAMQTLQHMYQVQPEPGYSDEEQQGSDHSPQANRKISPRVRVYSANRDKLYVTKCVCLITQLPFVIAPYEYLKQLYEAITKPSQSHLPLESYVYNILYEVPLPPPGRSMKFYGVQYPVFCQRPRL